MSQGFGGQDAPHISVMPGEIVEFLAPRPGGRYLDGTVGLGGHSLALLQAAGEDAHILGLDKDDSALALAEQRLHVFAGRAHLFRSPFSRFEAAMAELGWRDLDGAVLDLGVSSLQLDDPERGFSFLADGPLDMRMGQAGGEAPASRLVNKASMEELRRIIGVYGEEPMCDRIARRLVQERVHAPIETTARLAEIVVRAYPAARRAKSRNHPATKTFQALRIAVNKELDELGMFLEAIPKALAPGARVAILSFHSLEDGAVKRAFRSAAAGCRCPREVLTCECGKVPTLRILTKKPLTPSLAEIDANSRARSAKLRVAERLFDEGFAE